MQLNDLLQAQAIRSSLDLEPLDGPSGRIFPPTYPAAERADDKQPRHVVEELPDGRLRVLVDSVASQANRQDAALIAARAAGLIDFSDVYVDLSQTDAGI